MITRNTPFNPLNDIVKPWNIFSSIRYKTSPKSSDKYNAALCESTTAHHHVARHFQESGFSCYFAFLFFFSIYELVWWSLVTLDLGFSKRPWYFFTFIRAEPVFRTNVVFFALIIGLARFCVVKNKWKNTWVRNSVWKKFINWTRRRTTNERHQSISDDETPNNFVSVTALSFLNWTHCSFPSDSRDLRFPASLFFCFNRFE